MCNSMALEDSSSGSIDISRGREVLPTNVKPLHYNVVLDPNFKDFTFEGTVSIE